MPTSRASVVALVVTFVASVLALPSPAGAETGGARPGSDRGAAAVLDAGGTHGCAVLDGGSVKCWGDNFAGQLGLGDTADRGDGPGEMGDALPAVALGTGRTAVAVTTGGVHTCALLDQGSVKCWGKNASGQLGVGDSAHRGDGPGEMGNALPVVALGTGRTATQVVAGAYHTCAILDIGSVRCWGENNNGQLGSGDTADRGDGPGEMGDALPLVALGTGRTATALAAGVAHTCAVLDDGSVKCWGDNFAGQLGLGDTADRGDGPGEMGDALPAVALGAGRTAVAITAGLAHTCAVLDDGSVKCWGDAAKGQLGLGDTADRGDGPGEMGDALPAVALGTGRTAVAVSAGVFHTCALLDNGRVKCWGFNDDGRLGLGDTAWRGDGPGEMGDALPAVALGPGARATALAAGDGFACASLDDGTVRCWGYNGSGRLGVGDTDNRGDGPGEMGESLPAVPLGTSQVVVAVASAPAAPTDVVVRGLTGRVTVTWAAGDDGGDPVTSHRLEVSADGGATWSLAATVGAVTTGGVWGLDAGTYRVRVTAVNGVGASPPSWPSDPVTVVAGAVTCPTEPHGFVDVDPSSFAFEDIACIKGLGITTGTSPTTYAPWESVTREQMAAFLARTWRALGGTCPTEPHGFVDVDPSSFAFEDIACIKGLGITTGTSPTTYAPWESVTREQMAAFLARLIRAQAPA